jgi:uncharacterized protein
MMASVVTETLPVRLKAIYEEANHLPQDRSNLESLRGTWQAHVARARRHVRGLNVEADGEALYLGELSPGCRACKDGAWDCVFTTMRCNLDCAFCFRPHAIPRDYAGSTFGTSPEQIIANHDKTHITGVSFSGGEPFMDVGKLFEWVYWFKSRRPEGYYWVYTNGLLANEEKLRRLGELGIDEIRFNLAATGYDHPVVMKHLAAAAGIIPNLTVEIPAIPDHASKLLACLRTWGELSVRFINLHELMYEPGTNSAALPGRRRPIVTADGHYSQINPESRALTLAVMMVIQDNGLPLSVNDCSLQSKVRQLRGRRWSLLPLVKAPHEKLVDGEVLESYCAYRGEEVHFFHPDSLGDIHQQYPDHLFVRLARTAPLSVNDAGRWIRFETG